MKHGDCDGAMVLCVGVGHVPFHAPNQLGAYRIIFATRARALVDRLDGFVGDKQRQHAPFLLRQRLTEPIFDFDVELPPTDRCG